MIDVSYSKEENIIYINRYGYITVQDILTNIRNLDENFKNLDELYIMEDLRKPATKFEEKDLLLIIDEIKKRIVNFKMVRSAIIVDSPSETVLGFLYEEISKELKNYYFHTFLTIEAAKRWLSPSKLR